MFQACSGQDLSTETPNKNSVKMQQDEVFVNAEKVDSKDTLKVQVCVTAHVQKYVAHISNALLHTG